MAIMADQIRQFDEDGYVILDRILTSEQAERARAALARIFRVETSFATLKNRSLSFGSCQVRCSSIVGLLVFTRCTS